MFSRREVFKVALAGSLIATFDQAQAIPTKEAEIAFENLLAALENSNGDSAGAGGRIEAKELQLSKLGAAQPAHGKSGRKVSDRAIKTISAFEVSSRNTYQRKYRAPVWPGKASGITIGIGYDLGYVSKREFQADWEEYLPPDTVKLLRDAVGMRGNTAKSEVVNFNNASVDFDVAFKQFTEQTLPKYVALTEYALPNTDQLSDDSMGALVSLTFNRGASYVIPEGRDPKGRYVEMRNIREAMSNKAFSDISLEIRNMKRLWKNDPEVSGLLRRRDMEADLFDLGLS